MISSYLEGIRMQRLHSLFNHVFQTLRQALHRPQTLRILYAVFTVLILLSSLETLGLILADLNNPFVGYVALAFFLQVMVWSIFFDKICTLTCIQTSPASQHEPGPTE